MSKTYHVYSKMAADVNYNLYTGGGDTGTLQRVAGTVCVKGGAGVANKNIITPRGVHTEISEEERVLLLGNEVFQRHLKAGFVTIEGKKEDADEVAADLTGDADPSAPLTPENFKLADENTAVPAGVKKRQRAGTEA